MIPEKEVEYRKDLWEILPKIIVNVSACHVPKTNRQRHLATDLLSVCVPMTNHQNDY